MTEQSSLEQPNIEDILKNLSKKIGDGIIGSIIIWMENGLIMGSHRRSEQDVIERIATSVVTSLGIAQTLSKGLQEKFVTHTYIQFEKKCIIISAINQKMVLAVVAEDQSKLGPTLYWSKEVIPKLRSILEDKEF